MADVELGGHTVASHGAKLARFHLHDWIVLPLLAGLEFTFYTIDPFYLFVGKDSMAHLKYPLKNTTVPFWAVPIGAVLLPFLVFTAVYMKRRDVYDLHHAVLGTLYSVLATGMITDALKDAVGRPRPDFFWRCFPDGKEVYDNVTSGALCHGLKNMVKDGHKSFPSGHASWSFAGLGFFSWYLAGKTQAFDRRGHIAKLCLVFLPLLVASAVSISLVNDYMHHWGDVIGGGLLGLAIGSFCYLQFFPPPYHADGWRPHACLQALADTRNNASITQQPETETRNMSSGGGGSCSTEARLTVL